jgi:branched-chain amino acid transport system permease protein
MTTRFVRRAAIVGVVAGVAAWHLALVGLVDSFQDAPIITGALSLGEVLPLLVMVVAGYWAAKALKPGGIDPPTPLQGLLSGAVAGLVTGAMLALLSFGILFLRPNGMLIHATPALVNELRFFLDEWPGTLAQFGIGLALGLAGAGLRFVPRIASRPVVMGAFVTLFFGTMTAAATQILRNVGLKGLITFLYQSDGLSVEGAVALFVVTAVIVIAWMARGDRVKATYRGLPVRGKQTTKVVAFVLIAAAVLLLPRVLGVFLSDVITTVGLFVLMGLGLNIVVGFAGLLDLGYVAFYSLGIYATAVLTSPQSPAFAPQLNFWIALPIVMLIGGVTGLVVGAPVLRLRGDYLAIVTLGFGEIAKIIFLSDWMTPYVGGANGIQGIPAPELFGIAFRDPQAVYYPLLAACILAAIVAWSFYNSRVGRAWTAMREDETVAEATGVNTIVYKLMAFSMGAVFGSLAGAFYAAKVGVVFPQTLDIQISINALALIILGGMGNIIGVVVGAFVLVGLPGLLRQFSEYNLLIFSATLIAMMLFRPEGLVPNRSRRAELHEGPAGAGGEAEGGEPPGGSGGSERQTVPRPATPTLATESGSITTGGGEP